ncbi:hypothetical protein QQS21_003616 [Conoideocrella luteorostrata]|uniref:Uncharacterized protein n=1 Tax=Conoideocrella luteorostrata TaxID=1105319 RepID=A0AAJ0G0E9_9HYPO|nr:hypothetical protein QQS21_003616 [Conoideocrella luteorostrata]
MKFSKATSILFFCASAASAWRLPVPVGERSVGVLQDEALAKRTAAEVGFDDLERREAPAELELPPTTEEFDAVERRDTVKDAEKEILQYLRNINTRDIGGPSSWPTAKWEDLHGDKKSDFDGKYVCQVKKSGNKYEARVVAHKDVPKKFKKDHVFKTTTVKACKDKKGKETPPNYGRAVHYLRKAFGGEKPPKC